MPTLLAALPGHAERHGEYLKLVDVFAAPHTMIMDLLGEDRTYGAAAERHGTLFLCGEFPTMVIRRFGLSASISGGVGPFALGWIVERLADPQHGLST